MSDITIPPAALEAGARAYRTQHYTVTHEDAIRAAFLAMIEAWPGMSRGKVMNEPEIIILPLPQETTLNAQDISALDVKSTREEISDDQ